ncbi:hypothetical protein Tco_0982333 [Tanacetum coccineum]
MWILGSLCDSLQEQVVTTPGNAKALWDHLKELFHDNKDAKAINLDNKLRSIKIEKMTVNEYCTKIKSMADRLKNLGNMLLLKESSFHDESGASTTFESSSSLTNCTYGIFIIKQQRLIDDLLAVDSKVRFDFSDQRLELTATFSIPTYSE